MAPLFQRAFFLINILIQRFKGQLKRCPYCMALTPVCLVSRKKILLEILICKKCLLIFRYPQETTQFNISYYQKMYHAGEVTDLPNYKELESMMSSRFKGTVLDLSNKLKILHEIRPTGRVIDYGCSWGYGVWQLLNYGYQAVGFEISKSRAAYGRKNLNVQIIDDPNYLNAFPRKSFDIIFTNHVIEHLPNIRETLTLFERLLTDNGIIFFILPNFMGQASRKGKFLDWIGRDHPLAPTVDFFKNVLPHHGFEEIVIGSGPFDRKLFEIIKKKAWEQLDTEGDELLVIAWKK